eukprot:TRINITY_DN2253_c0_g1_i3.p1 TRINITY_DN2253_c0_g1~~TRINITY_DN2253_c0_g1_i3.p1  ORF type:complete len:431 (-),score=164.74 TRINITY_DN2253_c0_g1_i3:26-1318(-)
MGGLLGGSNGECLAAGVEGVARRGMRVSTKEVSAPRMRLGMTVDEQMVARDEARKQRFGHESDDDDGKNGWINKKKGNSDDEDDDSDEEGLGGCMFNDNSKAALEEGITKSLRDQYIKKTTSSLQTVLNKRDNDKITSKIASLLPRFFEKEVKNACDTEKITKAIDYRSKWSKMFREVYKDKAEGLLQIFLAAKAAHKKKKSNKKRKVATNNNDAEMKKKIINNEKKENELSNNVSQETTIPPPKKKRKVNGSLPSMFRKQERRLKLKQSKKEKQQQQQHQSERSRVQNPFITKSPLTSPSAPIIRQTVDSSDANNNRHSNKTNRSQVTGVGFNSMISNRPLPSNSTSSTSSTIQPHQQHITIPPVTTNNNNNTDNSDGDAFSPPTMNFFSPHDSDNYEFKTSSSSTATSSSIIDVFDDDVETVIEVVDV